MDIEGGKDKEMLQATAGMDADSSQPQPKKLRLGNLIGDFDSLHQTFSPQSPAPSNVQIPAKRTPVEEMEALRRGVAEEFPELGREATELVCLLKYFVDVALFSGHTLSTEQQLRVFLIICGEDFRAHERSLFKYDGGAWVEDEGGLEGEASDKINAALTALEGLFINLHNDRRPTGPLDWDWRSVAPKVKDLFAASGGRDGVLFQLCHLAKVEIDHTQRSTNNKTYNAHWAEKMADVAQRTKRWFDHNQNRKGPSPLWRLYVKTCGTDMPKNRGAMFDDVYLDDNWAAATPSREMNCYLRIPYSFHVREGDIVGGRTVDQYRARLRSFVRSFYYNNGGLFSLKLAMLKCAFAGVKTGKMLFEVGGGGDGKGMEGILDRALFGERNSCTLEANAFVEQGEFRKSGHCAWKKKVVRIQELPVGAKRRFKTDIWKRFIVGEEIDCRVNFGFTAKRTFGESMKVQECNYENIPVIEQKAKRDRSDDSPAEQIHRRVICSKVGKGVFTQDPTKVDTSKGVFQSVPLDELASFLADPVTSALFLQMYCVPFFKEYAIEDCVRMIEDLSFLDESTGSTFVEDTLWLAKRLSGTTRDGGRAPGCSSSGAESAGRQREADCLKLASLHKE